jgi:hypothetical protein
LFWINLRAIFSFWSFIKISHNKYKLKNIFYITFKITATIIHKILQANASLGKCQSDSLKLLHKFLFIAFACSQASYLTFIASYITTTAITKAKANKSESIQCFIAIAVVKLDTKEECALGIQPLHNAKLT